MTDTPDEPTDASEPAHSPVENVLRARLASVEASLTELRASRESVNANQRRVVREANEHAAEARRKINAEVKELVEEHVTLHSALLPFDRRRQKEE